MHHDSLPPKPTLAHMPLTRRLRPYLHDTAGMFIWLALRSAAQAAIVVMLARVLGASEYGRYVALLAVAGFFVPLANFGSQGALLRDCARHPDRAQAQLGDALALWMRGSVFFGLLAIVSAWIALPMRGDGLGVALFLFSDVAAGSLADLVGRAEQAREPQAYGRLQASYIAMRLLALVVFLVAAQPSLATWLNYQVGAALSFVVGVSVWLVRARPGIRSGRPSLHLLRSGLPFASGALALRLQTEFSKPVLAQLDYATVGNFGVAQRAVDLASLPLVAMQEALWPRVYANADARVQLRRAGALMLALALSGGIVLWLGAPLVPRILGTSFAHASSLLGLLAWLPAIQVLRNLGNAHLVASQRGGALTLVFVAGSLTGVCLNLALIPFLGAPGAVAAAYGGELVMIGVQAGLRAARRANSR